MMSEKVDTLKQGLLKLNLNSEQSDVFLYLAQYGRSGALAISRALETPRTNIYRILEELVRLGFVVELQGELGAVFETIAPDHLNKFRAEKEVELMEMSATLARMIPDLEEIQGKSEFQTKVVHYRGKTGLRQMIWNSLSAQNGISILEIESIAEYLGYQFAEKVRTEFVVRGISTRQITNLTEFEGWTRVTDFVKKYWEIRHLPKSELEMRFEVWVYNDVYAILKYEGGELFGLEVQDPMLSSMQLQMFDYLWSRSQQMEILDEFGAARVAAK